MLFDDSDDEPRPTPLGNQGDVLESDADRLVVNAEAGTGKTTTMQMKIEQAIEDDGVNADDILVLTFANKAAHEIENRLARDLPEKGHDINSYTYHSFCHSLLQEYAYHLDLPPEFVTVTEDRRQTVVQAVLDEMEYEFIEPVDPTTGEIDHDVAENLLTFITEMKHREQSPGDVRAALPTRETLRTLFDSLRTLQTEATSQFEVDDTLDSSNAPSVFSDRADEFRETIQTTLTTLSNIDSQKAGDEIIEQIREYLANCMVVLNSLIQEFESNHPNTAELHVPAILFGGNYPNYYADPKQDLLSRLEAYLEMLGKAHVYVDGFEAYEQYLTEELQAVDFDDLITNARYLLTESPYRNDILEQWEYVFCDEFQDTDQSQSKLVEALAEEKQLFVIGDRHQAIYEWRGANPDNIETIQSMFDTVESIDLDLNFRSPQGVLDFASNMPSEGSHVDGEGEAIQRNRMEAHKDDIENCVLKVSNEPGNEASDTATRVAVTASKLLTGQIGEIEKYDPEDIAVLTRKKYQAQAVAEALDEKSIPYSLPDGSGEDTSHGVQTVLAYLKLLVNPQNDVLLNRVLLMLYQVPRQDIARLNQRDEPSLETLYEADLDLFDATAQLERAQSDIEHLRECRETHSISELYQEFTNLTKVEWFISEGDRHDLSELERLISVFDEDDPLQSTLTEEFINHIELQESITNEEAGNLDTAEKAENEVNIMTLFQAKGLDFPVVILPFLSDDDWLQGSYGYLSGIHQWDLFGEILDGAVENPLLYDYAERDLPEEHRILHVGITRAAERLVVMGNDPESKEFSPTELDHYLASNVDWSTGGGQMDIWDGISDAYDETGAQDPLNVADISEFIDAGIDETPENLTHYGDSIDVDSAVEEVMESARRLRAGTLPSKSPSDIGIESTINMLSDDRLVSHQHSYSSLDTYSSCPRKHVLDHVIGAYDDFSLEADQQPGDTPTVSSRDVGNLFHNIAEEAYWRNYVSEKDEWYRASERMADIFDMNPASIDATKACIDNYFRSAAQEWTLEAVEVPFEFQASDLDIEIDDEVTVTGEIDALYRDADGNLIVIDYKTTDSEHYLEDSYQLGLYTLAADELYGLEPWQAGYLVLGKDSPETILFDESELQSMTDQLSADIRAVSSQSVREQFDDPQSGDHCTHCDHKSLGCGISELYQ